MIPGPDQVVACPHCEGEGAYATMLSGNNFGATYWSDSRVVAPMLVETPSIVKCPECAQFYWLEEARQVRVVELNDMRRMDATGLPFLNGSSVPRLEEPSEADYYSALKSGIARNADEERTVRMLAWWRSNDRFRVPAVTGKPSSRRSTRLDADWRANLELLLANLEPDLIPEECLFRSEILRALGRFEEARAALAWIANEEELAWARRNLDELCEAGDTQVRQLRMPDSNRA